MNVITDTYPEFETHVLEDGRRFYVGGLPAQLRLDEVEFEALWDLHPRDYDII